MDEGSVRCSSRLPLAAKTCDGMGQFEFRHTRMFRRRGRGDTNPCPAYSPIMGSRRSSILDATSRSYDWGHVGANSGSGAPSRGQNRRRDRRVPEGWRHSQGPMGHTGSGRSPSTDDSQQLCVTASIRNLQLQIFETNDVTIPFVTAVRGTVPRYPFLTVPGGRCIAKRQAT